MEKMPHFSSDEYDEAIFGQFQISKIIELGDLAPESTSLKEQKKQFLSGDIEEPEFTYEKIKQKDYWNDEVRLLDLKQEIELRSDLESAVVRAYRWAINERIAKLRMLGETKSAQAARDKADYEAATMHMKRFVRYSEFIYGKPEQNIFNNVMNVLQDKLSAVTIEPDQLSAYERLLAVSGEFYASVDPRSNVPHFEIIEVDDSGDIVEDADTLKQYFEQAITRLALPEGWKVEVDSSGARTAIAVGNKKIKLPSSDQLHKRPNSRKLTPARIAGLIKHEIDTHVNRKENANKSRFKLLASLDRYLVGEEGLATYREQQESGATDYAGFDSYFAAGLAQGLDGGGKKTFSEVHTILSDYYQIVEGSNEALAREHAWNRCVRLFRGTVGSVPGAIYTRDIIYRQGNIASYEFFNNKTNDTLKVVLDIGKIDPTNDRHISIIRELGLTDQEIEEIEALE